LVDIKKMIEREKELIENVLWVIRSAGERTTELCRHLIHSYFPTAELVVIHEKPFAAAVRKGFELGIESGKKWTACVDADVLLFKAETIDFLKFAETLPEHIFCVQTQIIDKFIPIIRGSGLHLYRNKYAPRALTVVPEDKTTVRPESETTRGMKALGYLTMQTNKLVGLHDFEQSYQDIFRKCFTHVKKHEAALVPMLERYWQAHRSDTDFEVALLGALAAKAYDGQVQIDRNFHQKEGQRLLQLKNIQEKPPLQSEQFSQERLADMRNNFEIDAAMQAFKHPRWQENFIKDMPTRLPLHKKLMKKIIRKIGRGFIKLAALTNRLARHI